MAQYGNFSDDNFYDESYDDESTYEKEKFTTDYYDDDDEDLGNGGDIYVEPMPKFSPRSFNRNVQQRQNQPFRRPPIPNRNYVARRTIQPSGFKSFNSKIRKKGGKKKLPVRKTRTPKKQKGRRGKVGSGITTSTVSSPGVRRHPRKQLNKQFAKKPVQRYYGKSRSDQIKNQGRTFSNPGTKPQKKTHKPSFSDTTFPRPNVPTRFSRPPTSILFNEPKLNMYEKVEMTKERLVKELMDTEREYVDHLKVVKKEFIDKVKSKNVLTKSLFSSIFGSFSTLIPINELFFDNLKKELGAELGNRNGIYAIVIEFSHCFKLYIQYILKYQEILGLMEDERKKNKKFDILIKCFESYLRKNSFRIKDLKSYLILPVQRIPRYRLLVENILKQHEKCTIRNERQHQEMLKIRESFVMIKEIAEYCDEKQKGHVLDYKLRALDKVLNIKNLIQPHRHLLKESEGLRCKLRGWWKSKGCSIYLFSDMFVVLIHHNFFLQIRNQTVAMRLPKLIVTQLLTKKKGMYIMNIKNKDKKKFFLRIFFDDESKLSNWVNELREQIVEGESKINNVKIVPKKKSISNPIINVDTDVYKEPTSKKMKKKLVDPILSLSKNTANTKNFREHFDLDTFDKTAPKKPNYDYDKKTDYYDDEEEEDDDDHHYEEDDVAW